MPLETPQPQAKSAFKGWLAWPNKRRDWWLGKETTPTFVSFQLGCLVVIIVVSCLALLLFLLPLPSPGSPDTGQNSERLSHCVVRGALVPKSKLLIWLVPNIEAENRPMS